MHTVKTLTLVPDASGCKVVQVTNDGLVCHFWGGTSITDITNAIGYIQRHIQRLFQEQTGCTMKQYQRIERINRTITYLQSSTTSLSSLAQLYGYYDEAHFLHDFQSIMHISPRTYQQQMVAFHNEQFKF